MWQSLQDWFFRNITTITIVVPVLAFLIPNLVLLLRHAVTPFPSDWLNESNYTFAYKLPVEDNWKQMKGTAKQQWGRLTDDDLDVIAGKQDELLGKIQERYGITKDEAAEQVRDWTATMNDGKKDSRRESYRRPTELKTSWPPWMSAAANFISRRRRALLVGLGVVIFFVIAAEAALSWGDNETKARTTALAFPPPLCSRSGNSQLLIFVHGWNGDPADTWKRFPELACADPTLAGVDIIVVNYPTFAKRRNLHIPALARWVNEEINKIDDGQKYRKIAIVAHSMGGLIGREMTIYRKLGDQQSIGLMVEIGTPHGGADDAKLANSLGISKDLTEEMMHDSTVLNTLTSQWFSFKKDRPYTFCLTSPQDSVVLEQSAMAFCDNSLEYPMWGHTEMVKPLDLSDTRYDRPISKIREFMSQ
jgi:uncharacterized protein YjbJ (UPF0337 family)